MELQEWKWQLTAIGVDNLLNTDRSWSNEKKDLNADENRDLIADEIDHSSPIPPIAVTDFKALKANIAEAFFIMQEFSEHAEVEGDFYYTPIMTYTSTAMNDFRPRVTWLDARDKNNKRILGELSQKESDNRKKYGWGDQFFDGMWRDKLPKKSGEDNIVSARGLCRIKVPTIIEKYTLKKSHLNKMQVQEQSALTLMAMENGNIRLSYYTPYSQPEVNPLIIVRNTQGQPLQQRMSMSSTPEDSVNDPRFKQQMRGTTKNIVVAGTPGIVDIYFPLQQVTVEEEFNATKKPDVIFGKLETPISRTRYEKVVQEAKLDTIDAQQLIRQTHVSFHEKTNYDKTKSRYVKITLPDVANSTFSKIIHEGLKFTNEGNSLDYQHESHQYKTNKTSIYIAEKSKDWSGKRLEFDKVNGFIKIKYPSKLEVFTIQQGDAKNGARLNGAIFTYPKDGDIPNYNQYFDTRPVIAYGNEDRRIALLDNSSFWNRKEKKLIFWGEPEYVKVKQIIEWIEVEIPVNLSEKDIQIDK